MAKSKLPNPGSKEAKAAGCTCPVMDNAYGAGRYGDGKAYGWCISGGCPLHSGRLTSLRAGGET